MPLNALAGRARWHAGHAGNAARNCRLASVGAARVAYDRSSTTSEVNLKLPDTGRKAARRDDSLSCDRSSRDPRFSLREQTRTPPAKQPGMPTDDGGRFPYDARLILGLTCSPGAYRPDGAPAKGVWRVAFIARERSPGSDSAGTGMEAATGLARRAHWTERENRRPQRGPLSARPSLRELGRPSPIEPPIWSHSALTELRS